MLNQHTVGKMLKAAYAGALTFISGLSTMLAGQLPIHAVSDGQWSLLGAWTLGAVGSVYGLASWPGPRFNGNGEPPPKSGP